MKLLYSILLIVIISISCSVSTADNSKSIPIITKNIIVEQIYNYDIYRIIDIEKNIICYKSYHGISCIKYKQGNRSGKK
jgi:uncharacterized membrane protein